MSDGERWQRLERLFDEALDAPPADLEAWLASHCADDPEMADRLRRMLRAHDSAGPLDRRLPALDEADIRARLARALAAEYELGATLGTGGMSVVLQATERKHDRPVVLKVLQPGLAAAIGPRRFEEEVRIAARLSHPHILPLIDSGEADGMRYFVMPFVADSAPLRNKLEELGTPQVGTTIMLLRDIADAMAHAHEAGVVHRDLKPENVLCAGGHGYLLDFGVAKLAAERDDGMTGPGLAIGTPGYMAPEQAAGQPVDHRADIYAWGLLAREMLTGSREPGADLDGLPGVPPTLPPLVRATLQLDPDARPASARALVAALDGMMVPAVSRGRRWGWLAAAGTAAVALGWLALSDRPATMPVGDLPQPIAVAPLRNETGDASLAGLGRLAGDWLTQGLHETGAVRVVAWPASRAAVERAGEGDIAAALRQATGAATAVIGSYYRLGDSLQLQVEVVDTERGIVLLAPAPIMVPIDSATVGVRLVRERLMGALAVRRDERLVEGAAFAARPPTFAAYQHFDRALEAFDAYRYADAFLGMRDAWLADTSFSAALVYAAYAAWNDGERGRADSLLGEVRLREASLSGYYRGLTDFIAGRLAGDHAAALAGARRAAELAPGSRAEYNVAQSLLSLNRPGEALAVLDSLDPDTGPVRGWPAYWSQRAYAAHLLGRHDQEYREAEVMTSRHPGQRVPAVIKARALAASGRVAVLDSLLQHHDLADPPDTYWSQGAMRVVAGEELLAHGDSGLARVYLMAAERWLRGRLAVAPDHVGHRYWLASALLGMARWNDAATVVTSLREDDPERIGYRGMAAIVLARNGDRASAEALLADAGDAERSEALVFRARVAVIAGDTDRAIALLGEALALGVPGWHWLHGSAAREFRALGTDGRFRALVSVAATP